MRRGHEFDHAFLVGRGKYGKVVFKNCLEWLRCFPFWMLGRESLYAVNDECELKIHRLFGPKCAVIVKGGDTLFRSDVIRPRRFRQAGHEVHDRLLGRAIVP